MTNADHVGACAFLHAKGTPADAPWLSWIAKAGICCNLPWTICLSPAFLPVVSSYPELNTTRGIMQSMQMIHSFCGSQAAFQAKAQRGCPRRPMLVMAQSEPQAQVKSSKSKQIALQAFRGACKLTASLLISAHVYRARAALILAQPRVPSVPANAVTLEAALLLNVVEVVRHCREICTPSRARLRSIHAARYLPGSAS